jgi:hypothetical protein
MPRNNNLRIHLECVDGYWRFTLHKNSQAHCSARGYQTAEEAAREAMVLNSVLKITKDSAERRKRRLESIKEPGPIVETRPAAEGAEIVGDGAEIVTATQPSDAWNV